MYAPHTDADVKFMLDAVGAPSLESLSAPPAGLALASPLDVAAAMVESDAYAHIRELAESNSAVPMTSFLGAGAYRHYRPPAVTALATRSEFLTAYTPYQAEASQGSLQAIYEWQTYICLLTGMDVSNASVYDGATALVEGVIMARNATGRGRVAVSRAVHPLYRAVLRTYAHGMGLEVSELDIGADGRTALPQHLPAGDDGFCALVMQSPNFLGRIDDVARAGELCRESGALGVQVIAEALSLALLKTPRELGMHIAVGEGQSFGLPLGYGGPYLGFVAATKEHVRRLPGRLVGETTDVDGRRAFVLTLQGREQHIRRELAASNICTNQALCALIATVYLAVVGRSGLRSIAVANLARTSRLEKAIAALPGFSISYAGSRFNEVVVQTPLPAERMAAALAGRGILAGLALRRYYPELDDALLMCATELTTHSDIDRLAGALKQEADNAVAAV